MDITDTIIGFALGIITSIIGGLVLAYKEQCWGMLRKTCSWMQNRIQEVRSMSKRQKAFLTTAFILLTASLVCLYALHFGEPSEMTFDRTEEIFSYDSILVLPRELDRENKGSVVDIYWVWGKSNFSRPSFSFDYLGSTEKTENLICFVTKGESMFKDIKDKFGIEDIFKKYSTGRVSVNSVAKFVHYENINYLFICENNPRGISVATTYLMNPANWLYHRHDSTLFFGWEDHNMDGRIQVNEIDVKPRKNPIIEWQPEEKEESYNPILSEFENNTAVIVGINSDELDLISAANIVWTLGCYLGNSEKPGFVFDTENTGAQSRIIIGGKLINTAGEGICEALNLNATFEGEKIRIQAGSVTIALSEAELDEKDVCIIAFGNINGRNTFLVAGVGKFGTLAGSLFLTREENWNLLEEQNHILILEWTDRNGDGNVEVDEISVENGKNCILTKVHFYFNLL